MDSNIFTTNILWFRFFFDWVLVDIEVCLDWATLVWLANVIQRLMDDQCLELIRVGAFVDDERTVYSISIKLHFSNVEYHKTFLKLHLKLVLPHL